MGKDFGRYLFAVAAVAFGAMAFIWHDAYIAQFEKTVGSLALAAIVVYITAAADLAGGVMMLGRRTLGIGAASVAAALVVSSLLKLPAIVSAPDVYNGWGDLFEQLSLLSGAVIVFAQAGSLDQPWRAPLARWGSVLFGICLVSFALEQAFYLKATADFVPAWIPPNPMFWAVATTIAFLLAALAMFTGRCALLATRLLIAMLVLFGTTVWLPHLVATPLRPFAWSETIETFAIAACAWIVAARLYDAQNAR